MDTYRVAEYQKDLNVLRDNDFALYHNDIKSVDMSTDASSATISLMRNGDGTSSPAVDGTLTITNGGGAGGKDTYVRISNTTNGQEVSKTFSTGSKVEAVKAMESATDITGLTINGETYNIKTGQSYTAGDNVSIKDNKISASNNYVSSARLNNYDELILEREGLNDLTVDLSRLTRGLSSTDYQLVANKNSSDGKYKVSNGEVTLTVKDMNNLSNKEVKTITISGLAGKEDLTHYFSVKAPPAPLPGSSQIGNYDNEGATGERSIAIGVKASASGRFSVAIGSGQNEHGATASSDYATAVGNGSLASGTDSTALGYNAEALGEDSVAVGYTSIANGKNSMALGVEARAGNNGAQADYATAVGALAHVNAVDGTALGQNAEVNSERGTALGSTSKVHAAKGTAIGAYTSVTAEGGVAIGQESVANRAAGMKGYAPVGEAGTSPVWKATDGAVSLGSDSSARTRQITNLAAGTENTDAVNVAQLKRARVELTNGTNTTVKSTNDQTDGHVIYSVDVKTDGAINKGDTNIVTGDTVYNALQNVSWTAKVNGQVAKTVKKDDTLNFINGDNIAITSNADGDIKISTTGLASSGDLWTAQAGGKDVTAVNQKVNFNSTDKHLVVESAKDGEITFATKDLADTSFTNITKEGNTYIKNLAKGEDRHIEAKEYAVGNDGSVTMTYVDGNGNTIDGTAKITGIAKSDLSNITNKGNTVINNIAKNAVKVIGGTNTAVETSTTDNGPVEYKVNLNKDVNLGDTIQLNGSDGSISAKSGGAKLSFGNNGLTVSQDKNGLTNETRINGAEITVDGGIGNQTTIKGSMARIGSVLVNGGSGTATITGLTNKTTNYTGFANGSGRAATEEQLKEVNSKATAAKTTVTNGKNITVDEAKANDGSSTYTVGLETDVVLGDNAIKLNGSDGSISAKSGGAQLAFNNSGLTVSQAKNGLTNETRIDGATITVDGGTGNQTIINGSTARIGSVLVNGGSGTATITGLTNKTTDYTGFANGSGRAATEEQLKEVDSKAAAAKTTVTNGKNITVDEAKADDGSSTYTVGLATDVVLGDNAIKLNGSDGSISAKSGGAQLAFNNSGLTVSQAKNGLTNETRIDGATITVDGGAGNQTIINGSTARIGSVLVNGGSGTATISGLTNQTTNYTGFANGSGRAATEEQLKEVAGQASEAITTAGKGWNLTTNKGTATNIAPGGTVDFSSGNDNLIISNAGADLSFSLSDNLDLTNNKDKKGSVKVGENTTLTDGLLQVGTDVSLTASALNVGQSSLTTSALMVGGLTYINSSGINANSRVISNVAAGIANTDAVNVGQLNSAINGSKVSIKAGDGITVEKTGNQYTIKTNIKGGSTSTGTVTVTTEDNTSTSSGGSSKLPLRQMAIMETAEMAAAEATTTDAGKAITIANTDFDLKFKTDAGTTATVNNGGTVNISGDDVNVSTSSKAGTNSDTIRIALNKDIKVDSITAKTDGGQLNIKSEVNMNSQKITNLAEGDISETSTDAVTGNQLYNTNQAVIANAENINSLSHSLNKLDSRINRVGAGAAALAALHPLDFDPDNKWDFAAGYGNYAGANAVAIGTYYRPNENTMFSIGGSFGGGENMINAGVSFKLGSGGSGITTSKTVMAKKIKEQDELLKAQDAKMKEQDEKIAKLEALVAQQGEMIQQALGKK